MIIEQVTNLQYSDPLNSKIDCMVKFTEFNEAIPFTADPNDVEEHSRIIYQNAINGGYGAISDYIEPIIPEALLWQGLRSERDKLLNESDWTQNPDAPVDITAWAIYRQALRDLPANTINPAEAVFPIKP